jgi:NifU-like protein
MTLPRFYPLPLAHRFTKKLAQRIEHPRCVGSFSEKDAEQHEMRLAIGEEGAALDGKWVRLYLLVDEDDGVIADAKFQVFGSVALIAAADAACELMVRKSYSQIRRITAELIDRHLRDKSDENAFPEEAASDLNCVLDAMEKATQQCSDIPYHDVYVPPPIQSEAGESYPDWDTLSAKEQIAVLEEVIAHEIRPYVELDAGGVQVVEIVKNREVIIAYEGSCTSCYSATGATLNAIQQILRSKIHPELQVVPDMRSLTQNSSY